MRVARGLSDANDDIETVFSTPSVFDPIAGTVFSPVQLTPLTLPSFMPTPAPQSTAPAANNSGDWWTTDVAPILTTAINAGAGVLKSLATPANPYGVSLPAGVSPLAFNAMSPAQQQAYLAQQAALTNPYGAQLKSMLPMLLLSGLGIGAFLLLKKR